MLLNANFPCNDLGLDVDGTAAALGWAFECFEKEFLSEKDTDGVRLIWRNGEAVLALIKKTAFRQGFGNLPAEGVRIAADPFGKNSQKNAMHIKGAPINEPSKRIYKGWALGVITSTRGA